MNRLICLFKGHDWKFAYNYGLPLGSREPLNEILNKFRSGEYIKVNRCSRCGKFSHKSDGLG
jgi:hypothetical protein